MLPDLPSLRFQPKFYSGGESRFHLPLFYDLVALVRPRKIVVLGFGDGQPHFTFCQALREGDFAAQLLTIRRDFPGENPEDDVAWQKGRAESDEFYHEHVSLIAGAPAELATSQADESVDLLLVDDCDSAETLRTELRAWLPKLSRDGVILFHGTKLQRPESPARAFAELVRPRELVAFEAGLGLAVAGGANRLGTPEKLQELAAFYEILASRIEAESRALAAEKKNSALELRQIWLGTLLDDRWKSQEVMDSQARELDQRTSDFALLQRDRVKAQLIMDTQAEQLKLWVGKNESLTNETKELKKQLAQERSLIKGARKACRKHGRCFGDEPGDEKRKRSIPERILRELRRIPANLSRKKTKPQPSVKTKPASAPPVDRYPQWITDHEPDAATLDEQRLASKAMTGGPMISLLLPTYNPPTEFLEALFATLVAQTYGNFEICVADGGSNAPAKELLRRWQEKEPRLRVEFLPENLGIAENTNRALGLTSGEFFACIDQDDVLAPFALYELARAIVSHPNAEIFYSDEDRLGVDGKRHSPFFKPEWNPEYLLSSMYLGHLTAYRRELVERVGGFRKEFDLSQDYDFALRATEAARAIVHIPQVFYHWREHPASGSAGGKPHARLTNLAALGEAMKRRGLDAEILEYPAANRARMKIAEWPKVSIIVPTDSAERARYCVERLPQMTVYPDYEIVLVTNSGLADALVIPDAMRARVRLVRYDERFNFSDKCNRGAAAASGSRLIFYNDDVESTQPDWIQNVIEPLANPEVGAVAPKLLYATGKIQHAGLVTGVRGLVGTACHQWPGDSTEYHNFAQSMRDVSALSAACLAMRRDDFFAVGKFDAINTPIAHSDLDLSFKVRAAGMRCVYTPFATLTHSGHASIGVVEEEEKNSAMEKVSVFLLKRWPEYACHDPYFPESMRDWLYADSPTPMRMWAREEPMLNDDGRALLFVSHDLSWSGAPLILLDVAQWCRARGFFVVAMSPEDGPAREKFVAAGIPTLVDPLVAKNHPSFTQLAREFDCVIASTIFGAPVIRAAKTAGIPHLWWIHEGRVAEHYLGEDANLRMALTMADLIVTPDTVSAKVYQPFTDRRIRILPYGIPDPTDGREEAAGRGAGPLKFLLLGTIEDRKGQQVLLKALRQLPADILRAVRVDIVGRPHDLEIVREIKMAATGSSYLTIRGAVPHDEALGLIRQTDVMMSCSWDETGPLILMEALALGKGILSTSVGAVGENLPPDEGGLFFPPGDAAALATAITRLVREPQLLARLQGNARKSYEKYFAFAGCAEGFEALVQEVISSGEASSKQDWKTTANPIASA